MYYTRIQVKPSSIRKIPKEPGVYKFYDENNTLLYIGASSNLFNRISQHLVNISKGDTKQRTIKELSSHIEYKCYSTIETAFEAERIEIWTNKPTLNKRGVLIHSYSYIVIRFNPFIHIICYSNDEYGKITENDEFYRINTSYIKLTELLEIARRQLPFCMPTSYSKCWDHQIGLCDYSCHRSKTKIEENFDTQINFLIGSISGKNNTFIENLRERMAIHVEKLQFMRAKKVLSAIDSINKLKLLFCGKGVMRDIDQFTIQRNKGQISNRNQIKMVIQRDGKNLSENINEIKSINEIPLENLILMYLIEYYKFSSYAPNIIQVNYPLSKKNIKSLCSWFKRYYGKKITIEVC